VEQDQRRGDHNPLRVPGPEREAAISRMVFEALDAGIIVEGPLGNIATANPASARILGTELDAVVGGRLERLVGPMVRPDGSPVADDELPGRVAIETGEPSSACSSGSTARTRSAAGSR
jgi:PAS domain-containing protein